MTSFAKKYLIVGPSWVGDMVMAQSLFIDIKQREPEAQIDVLAPAWTAAMVDRMPEVTTLIPGNFDHGKLSLVERFRLGKSLRDKAYTNAIVLPNSLKSALLPAFAKIPVRTGFIGEQRWGLLNDIRKLNKQALPMTVQRFVTLGADKDAPERKLSSITPPKLISDSASAQAALSANSLNTTKPILVLCPGAEFGASKQWPARHYADVAKHYLKQEWQVWLLGSANDVNVCDKINEHSQGGCVVLAGKTSLQQAVDLMSFASLVVSNDSGLMHIAAALQIPLVAVYGSTDPGHTPPLSTNHSIARLALECSPCFKRECPLNHLHCLNHLEPDVILGLAEQLQ